VYDDVIPVGGSIEVYYRVRAENKYGWSEFAEAQWNLGMTFSFEAEDASDDEVELTNLNQTLSTPQQEKATNADAVNDVGDWACEGCTFHNQPSTFHIW